MKKALLMKVNKSDIGAMTEVRIIPFEKGELSFYYKELECNIIDIVHAYGLSIDADIVIDDEGLLTEEPLGNLPASMAYGYLDHEQPIVGHALICKPLYTDDGVEETGFDDEEIDTIMDEINSMIEKLGKGV